MSVRLNVDAKFFEIPGITSKHRLVVFISDGCHQRINVIDSREINAAGSAIGGRTQPTGGSGKSFVDLDDWIQMPQILNGPFFVVIASDFNAILEFIEYRRRKSLNRLVVSEFVAL